LIEGGVKVLSQIEAHKGTIGKEIVKIEENSNNADKLEILVIPVSQGKDGASNS